MRYLFGSGELVQPALQFPEGFRVGRLNFAIGSFLLLQESVQLMPHLLHIGLQLIDHFHLLPQILGILESLLARTIPLSLQFLAHLLLLRHAIDFGIN